MDAPHFSSRSVHDNRVVQRVSVARFAWLSIGAAVVTIGLKMAAYLLTGSVGLLSDALESIVNLVGAALALAMLTVAARPPDEEHAYGHTKAEYFSSGVEGALIALAAVSIAVAAVDRLLHPQPIEQPGLGLFVSLVASLINFAVALVLRKAAKDHRSIALEGDSKHLMTDVITSIGVVFGVALSVVSGLTWLDPLVALIVAANIVYMGYQLMRKSANGLLDSALPNDDVDKIRAVLDRYSADGIQFHALRTRQAASRAFVSVHVLVPGTWSVQRGHQLLEKLEADVRGVVPNATVFTHLEPLGDRASYEDQALVRETRASS
jgi:cation diffusion facilitator family transporter